MVTVTESTMDAASGSSSVPPIAVTSPQRASVLPARRDGELEARVRPGAHEEERDQAGKPARSRERASTQCSSSVTRSGLGTARTNLTTCCCSSTTYSIQGAKT